MRYCDKCGEVISEEFRFCPSCGLTIENNNGQDKNSSVVVNNSEVIKSEIGSNEAISPFDLANKNENDSITKRGPKVVVNKKASEDESEGAEENTDKESPKVVKVKKETSNDIEINSIDIEEIKELSETSSKEDGKKKSFKKSKKKNDELSDKVSSKVKAAKKRVSEKLEALNENLESENKSENNEDVKKDLLNIYQENEFVKSDELNIEQNLTQNIESKDNDDSKVVVTENDEKEIKDIEDKDNKENVSLNIAICKTESDDLKEENTKDLKAEDKKNSDLEKRIEDNSLKFLKVDIKENVDEENKEDNVVAENVDINSKGDNDASKKVDTNSEVDSVVAEKVDTNSEVDSIIAEKVDTRSKVDSIVNEKVDANNKADSAVYEKVDTNSNVNNASDKNIAKNSNVNNVAMDKIDTNRNMDSVNSEKVDADNNLESNINNKIDESNSIDSSTLVEKSNDAFENKIDEVKVTEVKSDEGTDSEIKNEEVKSELVKNEEAKSSEVKNDEVINENDNKKEMKKENEESSNGINLTDCLSSEFVSADNKSGKNNKNSNKKKGASKRVALVVGTCVAAVIASGGYILKSYNDNSHTIAMEDSLDKQSKPPVNEDINEEINEAPAVESNNEDTSFNAIEKFSDRDFIINNTQDEKITFDSLNKYSYEELFIARNEMLARHGYVFTQYPNLQEYFESKSWYERNPEFSGVLEDETEISNEIYLKSMEFLKMASKYNDPIEKDFVFSDSNTRELTKEEVDELNDWELSVAKNEIYARYGMEFSTGELHNHFSSRSWYKINKEQEQSFSLNEIENINIDTILKEQDIRMTKNLKHDL